MRSGMPTGGGLIFRKMQFRSSARL
jgi:hypothetical protein